MHVRGQPQLLTLRPAVRAAWPWRGDCCWNQALPLVRNAPQAMIVTLEQYVGLGCSVLGMALAGSLVVLATLDWL